MNLNIHPIFVHFPIALLTIYALSELLYVKKIRTLPFIFYTKALLVILGSLSTFVTLQTGEWAAEGFSGSGLRLVELHSTWADITTAIFALLAGCYLVALLNRSIQTTAWMQKRNWTKTIWKILMTLQHFCIETPLVVLLALGGLVAVTVTGALGGSIVYGPNADPVVHFIYSLLVK